MNKINFLFALTIMALLSATSCHKRDMHHDVTTQQTINVVMKQGDIYTFSIPATTDKDDVYEISTQATNYGTSLIKTDANGNKTYQYTPAPNYTGTDQVILSSVEGSHNGNTPPPNNNGGCFGHGHDEDRSMIIINFTVSTAITANKQAVAFQTVEKQ
jgi:hypothetical protein